MPSAIVAPMTLVGGGVGGLHPDDPQIGSFAAQQRHTGGEPSPAQRHQDRPDVRALLEHLEAERPLPGDDVLVVERVDQHRAGACGELPRGHQRLRDARSVELDVGAVPLRRGDLGQGGAHRHEDGRLDPQQRRRQGDALRVVAGARRHHAAGPFLVAEPSDADVGPSDLERSGALEVLRLEEDVLARA
jgi:hypothetical protein